MSKTTVAIALAGLLLVGCGGGEDSGGNGRSAVGEYEFPPAPSAPAMSAAGIESASRRAASDLEAGLIEGSLDHEALETLVATGDPRLAWLLSDMLRFAPPGAVGEALIDAFVALTGVDPAADPSFAESPWLSISNHLIAWDLPAPPGYRELKGELYTALEPGWRPFFGDPRSEIDYRLLSWGGVLIDDRPAGSTEPCDRGCIPALDDPRLTGAADGDWYPDDRIVFGLEIGGEAVALPKNIMEVHEMVNITVGGRRLGIPYCTLCGSAQAYYTDRDQFQGQDLVLRTSGLLSRSNKVMYELGSRSAFDTFTGEALSGPLRRRGVELEQASVVTTTWGEWRRDHPDTRIIARDGGIGESYPLDPLDGRDDDGPIFPVGPVDPRLPVQERVLGVIAADGTPVAFAVAAAKAALEEGEEVGAGGVEVALDGAALVASDTDGEPLASHEAFWFAWSQFHPDTELWM